MDGVALSAAQMSLEVEAFFWSHVSIVRDALLEMEQENQERHRRSRSMSAATGRRFASIDLNNDVSANRASINCSRG